MPKFALLLLVLCLWTNPSYAVDAAAVKDLAGYYRGISHTIQSPTGLAEIDIALDGRALLVRVATGSGVRESRHEVADLIKIPKKDFDNGYENETGYGFRAFRGAEGYPHFYFTIKRPAGSTEEDFDLLVFNEPPAESIGPTVLYAVHRIGYELCDQLLGGYADLDIVRLPSQD